MHDSSIVTTPSRWFVRGASVGLLLAAAMNALSYFFRSEAGGNLLGLADRREALGFPVQLWESGNNYGGYFVDYRALGMNALFALNLGAVTGLVVLLFRPRLNRLVASFEEAFARQESGNFQFSLRTLLGVTCVIALVAAAARYSIAGRPEALGAIYALGPWILILIAYLPRKIPWQQRAAIVVPTAALLIGAAIAIGASLKYALAFDQVLMGIFVSWTPQCVIAAVGLTAIIVATHRLDKTALDIPID